MSEEEKKAIETLKDLATTVCYGDMFFTESDDLKVILNLIKKQQTEIKNLKMQLQDIHDNFCKFNWKESNPKQVHNQLKELYESIYRKVEKG